MSFKYKKTIDLPHFEKELEIILRRIEKLSFPKGFAQFLLYVIAELFANIKEHAKAKKGTINLKINKGKSLIVIADKGIGFKKSYLSKKIYVKNDSMAIELALSGLSTKDLQERGFGLYSIRRFIEKLRGKMTIESGLAKALIQKNKINFQRQKQKIQGVKIKIEAPIKKIDFYKILT